jgi:hypothetical protein
MRNWGWVRFALLLAGLAALGWSSLPVVPDCDSMTMGPGDTCVRLGSGDGPITYEEMIEIERGQRRFARVAGPVLVAAGLASFLVGPLRLRRRAAAWRRAEAGPDAPVARRAVEHYLGPPVTSAPAPGGRTTHLFEDGVVVAGRRAVESVVAWRDVDEVYEERGADPATREVWVRACSLVTGGRRTAVRALPEDRRTLSALLDRVTAARGSAQAADLRRRIEAGEVVTVGPFRVDARSVAAWGSAYRWDEVAGAAIVVVAREDGPVDQVEVQFANRPAWPLAASLRTVPNARAFVTVAAALAGASHRTSD